MIAEPTVGVRFLVQVDDIDLGAFDGCEGLGCEVVIEQREEGGNNGHVWHLPSRITYPNITLRRPLGADSQKVARWLASMTGHIQRRTGNISAMSPDGTIVAKWGLLDVVPVRWSGPSLGPGTTEVMTETVEIAHHGFMDM